MTEEEKAAFRRESRDFIAAEALAMWEEPDQDQLVIKLPVSKVMALLRLYSGFIYTEASGVEPIRDVINTVDLGVSREIGRQRGRANDAARRKRGSK